MTFKSPLVSVAEKISEWSGRILMWWMIPITALVFGEVCLRYFFRAPTVWSSELSSYIFGAMSLLGGAYVMRYDAHVRMSILRGRLSPRGRALMDTLTSTLTFLFCFLLAWKGFLNALDATALKETSGTTWDPPYWPYTWMVPLGAFLILVQFAANLWRDITVIRSGKEL